MNNLKLIRKTEKELKSQVPIIKNFSDNIHVEFRLVKCAKIVFKKRKLVHFQNLMLYTNREIQQPELEKHTCAYVHRKGEGVQH
jgi:hypothetical protein